MFKNVLRAEVSWNDIKDSYDLEALYKYYYPAIEINKLIRSPFRRDSTPSFIVNYKSGSLLYKDFGESGKESSGNLLQFVARLTNKDYNEALLDIISSANKLNLSTDYTPTPKAYKESKTVIRYRERKFMLYDILYWRQYFIEVPTLIRYNVIPISFVDVYKGDKSYTIYNTSQNPMYAYTFLRHPYKYKIYMPNRNGGKFVCNTGANVYEGYDQLFGSDLCIITSSMKDVMLLSQLGYPAISFQSESYLIPQSIVKELRDKYKNIYILYDYDNTGIKYSNMWKEAYKFKQIFTYNQNLKDPTDFAKEMGIEALKQLVQSQI